METRADRGDAPAEEMTGATASRALFVFLGFAGLMVVMASAMVVARKPALPEGGSPSRVARSPAEFPKALSLEGAVAGLPSDAAAVATLVYAPPPPWSDDMFESDTDERSPVACMGCHAGRKTNPERRKLTRMHDTVALAHGDLWCTSCHDERPNRFHRADGTAVELTEVSRLCGQCHAARFHDWETGAHGLRTGYWSGARRVLVCVNCHEPHAPRFKPLEPLPPPTGPFRLGGSEAPKEAGHGERR